MEPTRLRPVHRHARRREGLEEARPVRAAEKLFGRALGMRHEAYDVALHVANARHVVNVGGTF